MSAGPEAGGIALKKWTQSVATCVPTQSVGTRAKRAQVKISWEK
jgi:hypothetical protein